jgi:23S rRNA pseudouridine2605 synthase
MNDTSPSDKGERIAKAIARAGLASRRAAEQWIAAGRVAVNGSVIHSPALNVFGADRISVDGELLPVRERTRLFLYHKPRGLMTSHADPRGRPTIFQNLPEGLPRLISVGRLDFNTEGLLLLTNDGGLARVLELPQTGWLRRYRVRAHGSVTQKQLDGLRKGVTISGIQYREIEATIDRVQGSNMWLTFAIREGKNREVRNVLSHLGLTVTRLIRVSFGPFQLGELATGAVEEVQTRLLREQLGEHLVALAEADFSSPIALPSSHPERDDHEDERRRPKRFAGKTSASERTADKKPPSKRARVDQTTTHTWRAPDQQSPAKKLQRKYHGARGDAPRQNEPATGKHHRGLVVDRKGRQVAVERLEGHPPPQAERPSHDDQRKSPRGRRRAPDRGSGPRRRRPRPR